MVVIWQFLRKKSERSDVSTKCSHHISTKNLAGYGLRQRQSARVSFQIGHFSNFVELWIVALKTVNNRICRIASGMMIRMMKSFVFYLPLSKINQQTN